MAGDYKLDLKEADEFRFLPPEAKPGATAVPKPSGHHHMIIGPEAVDPPGPEEAKDEVP